MPRVVPSQVVGLIDQLFPFIADGSEPNRTLDHGSLPYLAAVLELIDQLPKELMPLGRDQFVAFVKSVAAIRAVIPRWQGASHRFPLYPFPDGSPLRLLRNALLVCPEESPAAATTELNFIPDEKLRESLRIDISAANRALANAEWKAATVLGGSVVEALLLWALKQKFDPDLQDTVTSLLASKTLGKNPGPDPESWDLHPYIEVAVVLKVIGSDTAKQARLAKDFRNLIHPGRTLRLGQVCDLGTALSALAAVAHIVRDLTPRTP